MSTKRVLRQHILSKLLFWSMAVTISLAVQSTSIADDSYVELLGENYQEMWRGYKDAAWPAGWVLADGVLSRTEKSDDLITVATYADFVLELEWKISSKGNSGILYRVSTGDDAPYYSGPEYQILDSEPFSIDSTSPQSSGSLYGLYAPSRDVVRPVGEWNTARILLQGNHVEHWLNGQKIVDCEIGSDDWNERMKDSKFIDWPKFAKNREGHIALQEHGNQVSYRKIRIRKLKPKP